MEKEDYDEYGGGTIMPGCPKCGQFCKIPDTYTPKFKDYQFIGSFATSYCKRCKKKVELCVEYI